MTAVRELARAKQRRQKSKARGIGLLMEGLRTERAPTGRCHLAYDLRFPEFYLGGPIGREGGSV